MTQIENNTESRKGKHLSYKERALIEYWFNIQQWSRREIAKELGRAPQTINQEIKDGTVQQKRIYRGQEQYFEIYSAEAGQVKYDYARENCGRRPKWLDDQKFVDYADKMMLEYDFSPDTVVGRAKLEGKIPKYLIPSTTTLYNWIDKGFMQTINLDLQMKLSRNTKKPKVRENKKILGELIEKRPDVVDSRERFGDWEIDTVIGEKSGQDQCLLTLTERKTRFEVIVKIDGKATDPVTKALEDIKRNAGEHFTKIFKTITSDNGSEFSNLSETLKNVVDVYFTHPYSSWERGTNENHNRMIRRYIPKGTNMRGVSHSSVRRVQNWMNNLPRKILGYATPHEAFAQELHALRAA